MRRSTRRLQQHTSHSAIPDNDVNDDNVQTESQDSTLKTKQVDMRRRRGVAKNSPASRENSKSATEKSLKFETEPSLESLDGDGKTLQDGASHNAEDKELTRTRPSLREAPSSSTAASSKNQSKSNVSETPEVPTTRRHVSLRERVVDNNINDNFLEEHESRHTDGASTYQSKPYEQHVSKNVDSDAMHVDEEPIYYMDENSQDLMIKTVLSGNSASEEYSGELADIKNSSSANQESHIYGASPNEAILKPAKYGDDSYDYSKESLGNGYPAYSSSPEPVSVYNGKDNYSTNQSNNYMSGPSTNYGAGGRFGNSHRHTHEANPHKIFIGNISRDCMEEDIWKKFSEFGDIKVLEYKNKFAFVEYAKESSADLAVESLDHRLFFGEYLTVQHYDPPKRYGRYGSHDVVALDDSLPGSKYQKLSQRTAYRLIFSNLNHRCTWQELKDFARQCGDVNFANVVSKNDGCFGIVEYFDSKSMNFALSKLNGARLFDNVISVSIDRSEPESDYSRADRRDTMGNYPIPEEDETIHYNGSYQNRKPQRNRVKPSENNYMQQPDDDSSVKDFPNRGYSRTFTDSLPDDRKSRVDSNRYHSKREGYKPSSNAEHRDVYRAPREYSGAQDFNKSGYSNKGNRFGMPHDYQNRDYGNPSLNGGSGRVGYRQEPRHTSYGDDYSGNSSYQSNHGTDQISKGRSKYHSSDIGHNGKSTNYQPENHHSSRARQGGRSAMYSSTSNMGGNRDKAPVYHAECSGQSCYSRAPYEGMCDNNYGGEAQHNSGSVSAAQYPIGGKSKDQHFGDRKTLYSQERNKGDKRSMTVVDRWNDVGSLKHREGDAQSVRHASGRGGEVRKARSRSRGYSDNHYYSKKGVKDRTPAEELVDSRKTAHQGASTGGNFDRERYNGSLEMRHGSRRGYMDQRRDAPKGRFDSYGAPHNYSRQDSRNGGYGENNYYGGRYNRHKENTRY